MPNSKFERRLIALVTCCLLTILFITREPLEKALASGIQGPAYVTVQNAAVSVLAQANQFPNVAMKLIG